MNTKEKILQKIKNREIEKKPKWFFVAKNSFFWALCGVSLVIGAAAFSIILSMIKDNDWDIYERTQNTFVEHVFMSIPYVWIAIVGISLWMAYREFSQTRKGYRMMPYVIVGASVVGSIILGSVVFAIGGGDFLSDFFEENVPRYESLVYTKRDIWRNPDRGLIAGTVEYATESGDKFILRDLAGHAWEINATDVIFRGPIVLIEEGMKVKIVGTKVSSEKFRASEIRPWRKDPSIFLPFGENLRKHRFEMKDFSSPRRN